MSESLAMRHGARLPAINITHPLLQELESELKNDRLPYQQRDTKSSTEQEL